MKSLLVILFTVGCATSASIELRGKYGKDAASWCNKLSKGFLVDEVVFVGHGAWITEELPGSLDRSLPSIAKFDKAVLDGFMKSINRNRELDHWHLHGRLR